MNRRRNLVLIAVIYGLAVVGLLVAIAAVAGILPLRPQPVTSEPQLAMGLATADGRAVPTLRPIWPADDSTAPVRRGTRTPLPARRSPGTVIAVPGGRATAPTATPVLESATPPPLAGSTPRQGAAGQFTQVPAIATAPPVTPAAAAMAGQISGRILINNAPPTSPLVLTLENQSYQTIARTTTGQGGSYAFPNVPASAEGYNVAFSQDANPDSPIDRVATWAWLGPVPLAAGGSVELPAFDVALLGFQPSVPSHESVVPGGQPVSFSWTAYPQATAYWLDLSRGDDQQNAWQSPLQPGTSATWDGTEGGRRVPGTYWWGVGARKQIAPYMLVLYSYLTKFDLQP